jgi:hypothetical protein
MILILIVPTLLSGCFLTNIQTGKQVKVQTVTNKDGGQTTTRTEVDRPLGDTQYDYQQSVQKVVEEAARSDRARAEAVRDITVATMRKSGTKTEAVLVGVFGTLALERMQSAIPLSLSQMQDRPLTISEAGIQYLDKLTHMIWALPVTVSVVEANKTARRAADNAGPKTVVSGSGNSTYVKDTKTISNNTNFIKGDNNTPTNTTSQSADCPTGNCEDTGFSLETCKSNPPGGIIDGIPYWTSTGCSCDSHAEGKC